MSNYHRNRFVLDMPILNETEQEFRQLLIRALGPSALRGPFLDLELRLGPPGTQYDAPRQGVNITQGIKKKMKIKLRCAVCMSWMREETSTRCGHLFCKACIVKAIQEHESCPICRQGLTLGDIHPIYLPEPSYYE